MGLPLGEVSPHDVMEWAQEQAQFLTPTQTLVLWYLCINAWHTATNNEGRSPGDVLSGRTSLRKIQMRTGLSQRAVRYALDGLQDKGYVIAEHQPGNGRSAISIFWHEGADEVRKEVRAGVRDFPEAMKRKVNTRQKRISGSSEDNIVEFRSGKRCHK